MARVLMYSGGLDSFILRRLSGFADEECLFVGMDTVENGYEAAFVRRHAPGCRRVRLSIARYALPNHIIPFRNHFLCFMAAQYASQIYFAFTAGDTTRDKDHTFQSQMYEVLNYFAQDHDKVRFSAPYHVHMPLKNATKAEAVGRFLQMFPHEAPTLIYNTVSCYAPHSNHGIGCGQCRSCVRKYVALVVNDVELGRCCRRALDSDPVPLLPGAWQQSKDKGRCGRELMEIGQAMELSE